MLELADIIKAHGSEFLERYGKQLLPSQFKALTDIVKCRTSVLGYNMYSCPECGEEHFVFHSCRNRHCPKCHSNDSKRWLEKQTKKLLPVPYFHMVITLPKQLRGYLYNHQKTLYALFMNSAAYALNKLAADPKYLGGKAGFVMILHTWTQEIDYHPHLHLMIPAGGIDDKGNWIKSNPKFFVPNRALSKIFKARFLKLARKALPDVSFPPKIWNKGWYIYNKPAIQGPDKVLRYIGRYVYKIAISNSRLKSLENGIVTFYKKNGQTLSLDAIEFLRRFVKHVLPHKFHKVRVYGFYHHSYTKKMNLLKNFLHILNPYKITKEKKPTKPETYEQTCDKCNAKMFLETIFFPNKIRIFPP